MESFTLTNILDHSDAENEVGAVILATFGILVYRYVGQESVSFDVATESRDNRFNSVQIDFSKDPSYTSLLATFRNTATVWKSCTDIQCLVPKNLDRWLLLDSRNESNHEPLSISLRCTGQVLVNYVGGIYNQELILRLAEHLKNLLRSAQQSPHLPASQLEMISGRQLNDTLAAGIGPTLEFERTAIPEAFLAQVQRVPQATALYFDGELVTYRDFYGRALKVAVALQQTGIGTETPVGVYLENPIAVAVSYMGIVIAGGVLVPLDPEWPTARVEKVIQEADLRFVISTPGLNRGFSAENCRLLLYDEMASSSNNSILRPAKLSPDNAAYVVFTSGSTGTPKGIVGLHRTLTSAPKISFPLRDNDVTALSANLSFGAGVLGLFFPLLQGAAVVLVSRAVARDLPALVRAWERAGVTRIVMVPPQARQLSLLDAKTLTYLQNITTLWLTGAVLTGEMLPILYKIFPNATILNLYSCLEVGTMSTRWVSSPEDRSPPLNAGRPLPNIRLYILGPKLNALPLGMPGEIYVGSPELSRGYLSRPELTRDRFLPNPFNLPGASRMYRTGDIGRLLAGGDLEYLGRSDNQVKIRGIRIELEEIEAVVQSKPEVHQTAVIVVPQAGESRLVAFVSAKPNCCLSVSVLRQHVSASLPIYMVPALFVLMDHLPVTPNGKINRQALPTVVLSRPELNTPYIAPRGLIERAVARIWEDELGIEGVGADDHFLEVGGDSLIAVRVAVRLQEDFRRDVAMASIFEFPTIRSLAGELSSQASEKATT